MPGEKRWIPKPKQALTSLANGTSAPKGTPPIVRRRLGRDRGGATAPPEVRPGRQGARPRPLILAALCIDPRDNAAPHRYGVLSQVQPQGCRIVRRRSGRTCPCGGRVRRAHPPGQARPDGNRYGTESPVLSGLTPSEDRPGRGSASALSGLSLAGRGPLRSEASVARAVGIRTAPAPGQASPTRHSRSHGPAPPAPRRRR